MSPITDMHCHILPGLDDGSQSMDETRETLQEAVRQNITRMIVTPHFHPERYVVYADQIREGLEAVKQMCRQEGIEIELQIGQECYYYSDLVKQLDEGKALTLCGSRFVLVEFDPDVPFSLFRRGLDDLRQNGYIPIVAHFERYQCLYEDANLEAIRRQGTLLQMNYDTLRHKAGLFSEGRFRKLARMGYVDYFGSDCHGTHYRPLKVNEALAWMEKKMEPNLIRHALLDNFDRLFY